MLLKHLEQLGFTISQEPSAYLVIWRNELPLTFTVLMNGEIYLTECDAEDNCNDIFLGQVNSAAQVVEVFNTINSINV